MTDKPIPTGAADKAFAEFVALARPSIVKVKALEWKGPSADEAYAEQGGFVYTIRSPNRTPGWRVWVALKSPNGAASIGGCIVTMKAENLDDAMAAAQADYNSRILSALETPSPSPDAGSDEP